MIRYLLDTNVLLHVVNRSKGYEKTMIAGIALDNDYTLVTDNMNEFQRVAGLKLENWRL